MDPDAFIFGRAFQCGTESMVTYLMYRQIFQVKDYKEEVRQHL